MKAKTICPICKKEVIETCWGCITGNMLVCLHKDTEFEKKDNFPDILDNIEWEIIEK